MRPVVTDEDAIRQVVHGCPTRGLQTLYQRYVNKVYRRCLSMTKDTEKAYDFTHDIFLKVFDRLDTFQERSSFSTWLYAITYNYCADQLRIAGRINIASLDSDVMTELPDERVEESVREEMLQLMNQAVLNLTAQERLLLRLRYTDGLSIEQLAEFYGIKLSAVKMRLRRCREKIRERCSNRWSHSD